MNVIADRPQVAIATSIDKERFVSTAEEMAKELVLAIEARGAGCYQRLTL
jgi:hypothetical protein